MHFGVFRNQETRLIMAAELKMQRMRFAGFSVIIL